MESLISAVILVVSVGITLWMAGAIYCDVCNGKPWAPWLVLAWLAGVIGLFLAWETLWQPFAILVAVFALFLIWWFGQ